MIGFLRRLYLKRTLKRVKQVGINALYMKALKYMHLNCLK